MRIACLSVLVIGDSRPVVVELILTNWSSTQATFKMNLLKGAITNRDGPVTLYVDAEPRVNPQITD